MQAHGGFTLRRLVLLSVSLIGVLPLVATSSEQTPLAGYSAAGSAAEREWEAKFRAMPSADNLRESMQRLTARPHHVGSPYDKDNAEWILAKLKGWGLDAHIETFDVLFPTPKARAVELVAPTRFVAKLQEPALAADPTSGQRAEQLPTYNAYSADGDVTAPLVYVNYGIPEDYERLERLGISVRGAIVIARYGHSWRGIKPKVAAEHGAVGCLIYSDPNGDGYFDGDVFPQGAWRPRDGVQRGSVVDMPIYPGDPLTPGVGATKDAQRLPLEDVKVLTRIPVLPLSYADAQPFLAALAGPVAPEDWRGSLAQTYHVGPGPAKVHLRVQSNWDLKTLYDVIARIPGSSRPDEWILRGNHHDAWVNGAQDPVSGAVALLEESRGLSELLKQGWRPTRTILFCFWDGEEPGLLGSTEWAEQHAEELRQHAAVYVNSDGNARGYLSAAGSHTLERFLNGVAREVQDPEKAITVWQRGRLKRIADAKSDEERGEIRKRADLRIDALGSGSDYTVFLDHLGVASLNLGFGDEDGGGIYHSIYDDFYWYTHFSDTDFSYGRALSQTAGTAVMRLADADLLPYDFTALADTLGRYADELKKLLKARQDEARERNEELDEGLFAATDDPKQTLVPPPRLDMPPHLNFAPLENAVEALTRAAQSYEKALSGATAGDKTMKPGSLDKLNATLIESERKLTSAAGLPGRPWFRHLVYAPGQYTGYGVKTLPGVREAIEQRKWSEADEQIANVAEALRAEAKLVESAAALLKQDP
jgi:N-acetylated-alpha-linked acidic dipeptidase